LLGGLAGFTIMFVFYLLGVAFAKARARRMRAAGLETDDEEALGAGDVILSTVLGLFLGWPLIWVWTDTRHPDRWRHQPVAPAGTVRHPAVQGESVDGLHPIWTLFPAERLYDHLPADLDKGHSTEVGLVDNLYATYTGIGKLLL
ncbi:hypothetical protein EG834_21460, partial [bacterium]|nr:hypothetical protein [bacterium]